MRDKNETMVIVYKDVEDMFPEFIYPVKCNEILLTHEIICILYTVVHCNYMFYYK